MDPYSKRIVFKAGDHPVNGRVCEVSYYPPCKREGDSHSIKTRQGSLENLIKEVEGDLRHYNPQDYPITVFLENMGSGERSKIEDLLRNYREATGVTVDIS